MTAGSDPSGGLKPVPVPDIDTAPYWNAADAGQLCLPRCRGCGKMHFPPKPYCPLCLSDQLEWVGVSGRGVVHSFCIAHMPLIPGFQPPYAVVTVELEEQADLRLTTNLVGCGPEAAEIGMAVEVVFERRAEGIALPQFRPAAGPAA